MTSVDRTTSTSGPKPCSCSATRRSMRASTSRRSTWATRSCCLRTSWISMRNRASASSDDTTFARWRSSNSATPAFLAGKIPRQLRIPTNNLFSLWSRPAPGNGLFGVSPVGVNLPGGPNPESERATFHAISAESDLQTAEISYRRYWLGYIPRISGTLLAGFRYTRLDDDFTFRTQGSEPATNFPFGPLAALKYDEDCENNLAVLKSVAISGSACVRACGSVPKSSSACTTITTC